jgi:phage tail sheath gpL-like
MSITVPGVAAGRKTPAVYLNVEPGTSGAGGTKNVVCVLVGQVLATGSMSAGDVEFCASVTDAKTLAGQGSELHLAAIGFFANNSGGTLYLGACTAGAAASTRTVVFANNATADGYYYIWCNGNQYTLEIANADTIANMADNLAAGLQAQEWYGDLPFTCASDTIDTVTFTTKMLGPQSQWMVSPIYQSDLDLPGTTTATLAAVTPSAGADPTLTTVITALGASDYDYIGWTSLDATAITAIEAYLSTQCGPLVGYRQQSILCSPDVYANAKTTAQTNLNLKRGQCGWSKTDRETYCESLGRMLGKRSAKEESDPSSVYYWEKLDGYRGHHDVSSVPSKTEIENCLNNSLTPIGMSGSDGCIVRSITSYSLNGGVPDYSCLDTASVTMPDFMADVFASRFVQMFAGKKLAADYTEPTDTPPGVVTPKMAKDLILVELKRYAAKGWLDEVTAAVIAQIGAEKDSGVAGRLNAEIPIYTMDGCYVIAANVRGM